MTYKILVAEDDADIVELLTLYLENAGFEVYAFSNGIEAYHFLSEKKIDLAIFDIMMPGMSGYELTKKVRQEHRFPIIILSAKNQDSDKILGLDIGADDYMTKPFNPLELVARVKSSLRRFYQLNEASEDSDSSVVRVGELILDTKLLTLHKNEQEILLTPTEYKILALLMQSPGRVYTKVQIYEHLNGAYFENDDNTMMVHISNIRDKIEEDSKNPIYLKTVRGLGYKIEKK